MVRQPESWFVQSHFESWPGYDSLFREFTYEAVKELKWLCITQDSLTKLLQEIRKQPSVDGHYRRADVLAAGERLHCPLRH